MPDPLSRRRFLAATAALGLAGCVPAGRRVTAAPAASPNGPVTQDIAVRARVEDVDLGGTVAQAWTFGGLPGPTIRAAAGDRVRITVHNELPEATSVHWHGLAIPNPMDGVPGVTTPAIEAGGRFTYDFVVPDPGTHWFHPHTGLQLDTGLYAPFIVDDPSERGGYDVEWVLVLDDWTQGVGRDPQQIFDDLVAAGQRSQGPMMHMGGMGMDGGDVSYPMNLINGRAVTDPDVLRVKPGQRVRLRIINAAADTMFTLAVAGHRMRITHSDGYPVQPVDTDSLRIGMGERYDALVDVSEGAFEVTAEPLGKAGRAVAILRSTTGTPAPASPVGYPLTVGSLLADTSAALPDSEPAATQELVLSGSMAPYVWTINGAVYDRGRPVTVSPGERLRLRLTNMSMMSHPIHLHGHTFAVGGNGPRKDTLLLTPMARAEVDLVADNPGRWMLHCHNAYHAEAGMMTRLDYTT